MQSSSRKHFPELTSGAIKFFVENQLYLTNVIGARVGIGLRELPAVAGFQGSVSVLWRPGATYTRIAEHAVEPG
eukprot:11158459-Lingulodinium_polyedra.AAC.1